MSPLITYPTTVTIDLAGTVIVKAPAELLIGLSCVWFSFADVRYGVTLAGGVVPVKLTVTVCEVLPVLASTTATLPLAGLTAVTCNVTSVEVDPSITEPGRMNRLNWPTTYKRFGTTIESVEGSTLSRPWLSFCKVITHQ